MNNGKPSKDRNAFDFKPLRWAQRPGSINCVGLALDENTHKYHVLYFSASGGVYPSGPYSTRSLAEMLYEEKCAALAETEMERLSESALTYNEGMPAGEKNRCAEDLLAYLRLRRADDEVSDAMKEQAQEFVASHTPEELDEYVRDAVTKYQELQVQDEQYQGADDEL